MDVEDVVFMLAGPVKIHPRVLRAMLVPSVAHRGPEFSQVNAEIRELLKYLFQTEQEVALLSGSGTAGLESAVSSLFRKQDRILCITNGKFGERLYELSKVYADPTRLDFPWGNPVDLEKVRELAEKEEFKGITLCHNETSTGLTNQAKEIGKIAKEFGLFYILDGITSVGGLEVRPDEWGADVTIMGSQKCVAAPAGLSALCASERAMEAMHSENSYYLDLKKHILKLRDSDQTPYTPAIPLFLAFREALRMLKEEGIERRIERNRKLAEATRAAVDALGLQLFPVREYASNTVTAIRYPDGIEDGKFRKKLKEEHRVIVAGAQAHIKGKVFRIGHMGICSFGDLIATFGAIEAVLNDMGYKVERGAAVSAISERM